MSLVALPPTRAGFLRSCSKPEAFESIEPPVVEQVLGEETSMALEVALSDRATFPILKISDGFLGAVFCVAGRRLMGSRGYNRDAGADEEIVKLAERADAYLKSCGPGAMDGKRVTPEYIDSKANAVTDGVSVSGHARSDWYALSRCDPDRRRPWTA